VFAQPTTTVPTLYTPPSTQAAIPPIVLANPTTYGLDPTGTQPLTTANLVTAAQLTAKMMEVNGGSAVGNHDQWNWVYKTLTGIDGPDFDFLHLDGSNTDAKTYLDGLRSLQQGIQASLPGGGGSVDITGGNGSLPPGGAIVNKTTEAGKVGNGVMGPTTCKFCQEVAAHPFLVIGVIVALFWVGMKGEL